MEGKKREKHRVEAEAVCFKTAGRWRAAGRRFVIPALAARRGKNQPFLSFSILAPFDSIRSEKIGMGCSLFRYRGLKITWQWEFVRMTKDTYWEFGEYLC